MKRPAVTSFKQGDETWTTLRQRFLDDLFFCNSVVLGFANFFPMEPKTHLLLHLFLERKTGIPDIDDAPYQKVEQPRGSGKTLCGTVGTSIQMGCRDPNTAILIANERQETANGFLAAIKHQFETNDLLRALFPEVIPPDFNKTTWSATAATLQRTTGRPEPTYMTIGVGGTVTGIHPDHIIVDDPISREAMENARAGSWLIMDKANRWIHQLKPLLNTQYKPFPTLSFRGTRWWQNDTHAHIEEVFGYGQEPRTYRLWRKLPGGEIVSREIYRVGDIAVFRMSAIENGQPAFPKLYDETALEKLQMEDPELYAANYLNNPSDAAVRTFQDAWLRYWQSPTPTVATYKQQDGSTRSVLLSELYKITVVDPAFTAQGGGDSRPAIVTVGIDTATGTVLVLEATADKRDPKDLCTDIINAVKRHKSNRLFIEQVAQQLGFIRFVESEIQKAGLGMAIESVTPGGRNKDVRIETLVPHFKTGNLLVHPGQQVLLQEFRDFKPGARHKDVLDALAYCLEKAPNYNMGGGKSLKERNAEQLKLYRQRRGLSAA